MKIPRLKIGDAIEIIWVDASLHENGMWMDEDELLSRDMGMPVVTRGTFIRKNTDGITICGLRHTKPGYETKIAPGFDIPIGCIKEIHKLRRE